MGGVVTAISRTDSKREQALELGATDFLISTDEEAMAERQMSFDVLLNTVILTTAFNVQGDCSCAIMTALCFVY